MRKRLAWASMSASSDVSPELDSASTASPSAIMPRSPWLASAGWTNCAGVPVEASVDAILRATWPLLPMPVTVTRPLMDASFSIAAAKAPSSPAASASSPAISVLQNAARDGDVEIVLRLGLAHRLFVVVAVPGYVRRTAGTKVSLHHGLTMLSQFLEINRTRPERHIICLYRLRLYFKSGFLRPDCRNRPQCSNRSGPGKPARSSSGAERQEGETGLRPDPCGLRARACRRALPCSACRCCTSAAA